MFRRVIPLCCWYNVPQLSRVGIFPLHLDPPTVQHRELFRLLVGDTNNNNNNNNNIINNNNNNNNISNGVDSTNSSTSLWYLEPLAESLKKSERVPFDHLIVVPNTRFPVALRLSTHLAALTTLVTRGLPRVHVDFTALEHPDEDMPCVYELTQRYKNSTLVHWLQDAHEMQKWAHFGDVKLHVPMLLLQTVSLPVSVVGRPPDARLIEKTRFGSSGNMLFDTNTTSELHRQKPHLQEYQENEERKHEKKHDKKSQEGGKPQQMEKDRESAVCFDDCGTCSTCGRSPRLMAKGRGEEEVEISRSYKSSSTSSWLASSDDLSMNHLGPVDAVDTSSYTSKYYSNSNKKTQNSSISTSTNNGNDDGISNHSSSGSNNNNSGSSGDGSNSNSNSNSSNSSSNMDTCMDNKYGSKSNDGGVLQDNSTLSGNNPLLSTESEDNDTTLRDTVPARRKVRHLIEDLFSTPHDVEIGDTNIPPHGPAPHVEVHAVHRCTGADVRQALWEREVDPALILTEPVHCYIKSHSLYHDYRKDASPKMALVAYHSFSSSSGSGGGGGGGSRSSGGGVVGGGGGFGGIRRSKVATLCFSAALAFPGLIPRLELHYDKNNLLAREYYESLSAFQACGDEEPDLIVPIGGDGYMMHCIRNNWSRFIPFFGVNAGHVGYLLNDASTLSELFSAPLKLHTTTMLYCLAEKETETGEKHLLSELAFNDAWVERSSGQTALIRILVNGEERIRLLRGDGVLVATAAGSTAYCRALGASPVPVGAPLIQVVGSNVVSPAQWRPTHLNQEDQVELEVLDSARRPCRCFVDSVDVGNVTRMLVRSSRAAGVVIAFASSCDLQQKLYQMQFPTGAS
ncbi:putative inorganic polyphosphate/ATP-NAD kinase, putative,poly(p)/ATP NAD kinase [Trypanosoma theileri]|uniref:Putative inorganic polyphosphate/ATP-NAD kinase, putative,poly(P)/ATP NAD kinase n=1 Tax=Trypanosoma theileri TaxID=67003 RepID=A0A1X0NMB6_9TRYP|nr:putative inorganic polyphosphate/ATP-NAD kinase, putative,poly(p)/ATP NAD kinase [Trypanosoma theileri]ORC85270.1 putative inorganic polyphosphate/ATP-NAD kinase, putative,poly(p)/ATP NAD kinase [Trypanosoma theileri]